ncbi:hypothetical protein TAMC210_04920 [Thermanaeromonas sp. C210]|nr:hypothetical protein TAMC210_04920 [Thermanaeromonas sp. C210]
MGLPHRLVSLSPHRLNPKAKEVVTVMRFTAVLTKEGQWYVAKAVEVEVASQGRTIEEALANLKEALELYFEDEPLPEALPEPIIATVEVAL